MIYLNANVSVSVIFSNGRFYLNYYFVCQRPPHPLVEIQQVSNATFLFSIFMHQNTKSTARINVYSILKELPKALLKMFLTGVDRLTLPTRPQDVVFEDIF